MELINRLVDCGIKAIEAASFVSPKWVPNVCFRVCRTASNSR